MSRGFERVTNYPEAFLPVRATKESAGYDFFACVSEKEGIVIKPNQTVKVHTGIKAYMEQDEVLQLYPRSSAAIKRGLVLLNVVGIIDADYYNNPSNEGEIMLCIHNIGDCEQTVYHGEALAQGIFQKYLRTDDDTVVLERKGGIGSTGRGKAA